MTESNLYESMYEKYKEGLSLAQVGSIYGITRQSVYAGFKRREFILRPTNYRPYQILDGIKFTLRNQGYYSATTGDRELMHRYVWKKYNGDIPPNHDIHHKDRMRENNNISNLELYTKSAHAQFFSTGSNQHAKKPFKDGVVNG